MGCFELRRKMVKTAAMPARTPETSVCRNKTLFSQQEKSTVRSDFNLTLIDNFFFRSHLISLPELTSGEIQIEKRFRRIDMRARLHARARELWKNVDEISSISISTVIILLACVYVMMGRKKLLCNNIYSSLVFFFCVPMMMMFARCYSQIVS